MLAIYGLSLAYVACCTHDAEVVSNAYSALFLGVCSVFALVEYGFNLLCKANAGNAYTPPKSSTPATSASTVEIHTKTLPEEQRELLGNSTGQTNPNPTTTTTL